ncbi:SH3 domain-containing protein [Undibacterium sp. Ji83W]|uniref:SH3 domain-containing protein n=1 Tax=Undibacterium sp. Ji83W TaxID=3413043 RepID=UPI003BF03734
MRIPILMLTSLAYAGVAYADSASTIRSTALLEKASADSAVLATLSSQTKLDAIQRQGAWQQVKTTNGQLGWVDMMSLRFESNGTSNSVNTLKVLGRTSNTGSVGTGVNGLDKTDLARASPNYSEYQKMQRGAIDRNTAQSFGQRSKLSGNRIEYLDQSRNTKREDN